MAIIIVRTTTSRQGRGKSVIILLGERIRISNTNDNGARTALNVPRNKVRFLRFHIKVFYVSVNTLLSSRFVTKNKKNLRISK